MTDDEQVPQNARQAGARADAKCGPTPGPVPPPEPTGTLYSWQWVILAAPFSAAAALVPAVAGHFLLNPFGGEAPDLLRWGTLAWLASAALAVGPPALVPGPARGVRAVVGLAVGAAWFAVGRFVLS